MLGQARVPRELAAKSGADAVDEAREPRDPAPEDDPLRCERVDERAKPGREVAAGERSSLGANTLVGVLEPDAEPGRERRPAGQPLQAVAVERADPGEVVACDAWHRDVAHLGVDEAGDEPSVAHRTASDPGTDREIEERAQTAGRTPATLPERRAVDVRVESDRNAEPAPERTRDVGAVPAGLRRPRHVPPLGMPGPQLDGTERGDAERLDRIRGEERDDGGERGRRITRRDPGLCMDVVGARPRQAHDLGAAQLHAPKHPTSLPRTSRARDHRWDAHSRASSATPTTTSAAPAARTRPTRSSRISQASAVAISTLVSRTAATDAAAASESAARTSA